MGWLTGYTYRKKITITGRAGAGTNYQVKLQIGNASGGDFNLSGHAQSFPNDIRFTSNDGSTLLDYWIENVAAAPITVWIKVIDSLESNVDIYCYYGKASDTTTSNATNTFNFFDNLESGTLSKWSQVGKGTINSTVVHGGTYSLKVEGLISCDVSVTQRAISNSFTPIHNLIFEYWFQNRTYGGGNQPVSYLFGDSNNFVEFWADTQPHTVMHTYFGVTIAGINIGWTADAGDFSANTWYHAKIVVNGTNIKWYFDTVNATTLRCEMTNAAIANLYFSNIQFIGRCSIGYFDDILVRKYTSPEPTFSMIDAEQTPPNITATNMSITTTDSPCRVGICTINVSVTWTNNGGSTGPFTPSITVSSGTVTETYPSEQLAAGAPVTYSFTISGMTAGTCSICPNPN